MNTRYIILFSVLALVILGFSVLHVLLENSIPQIPPSGNNGGVHVAPPDSTNGGQACTQEAKQCPDGSYVGRTGPNCTFALCPQPVVSTSTPVSKSTGTLRGVMTIGPICPVERVGHPCTPTPEMYASHSVYVYNAARTKLITTLIPDAQGNFSATLPVGSYVVDVAHQAVGSARGAPSSIQIYAKQTTNITIDIDTGIR